MSSPLTPRAFFRRLKWIDGRPLLSVIEPYRLALLEQFNARDEMGRLRYDLMLAGRAKKCWKSTDGILNALYVVSSEPTPGYDIEVEILANDQDQARDDLNLAKKIVKANPVLQEWLVTRRDRIERKDGRGYLEALPAGDVVGQHGKSYRLLIFDEIHGFKNWDVMEAMQPDPHRPDVQQWITSYASLFHRPGVPLFDLMAIGKAASDPRMLFSWYSADFTTDATFADKTPEERANPSMGSWKSANYLAQQKRRLPAHKYRRLHLNLPGLPEGSALSAESVMDAVDRSVAVHAPVPGRTYAAFVDMSGGSNDDAVIAIAHRDPAERVVIDRVLDQGAPVPFDPRFAVARFASVLADYGVTTVTGDRYAGETFRRDFERFSIRYKLADRSKSDLYEGLEPILNGHRLVLLNVPKLEQQLLGLVWRGGRIDHPSGEHDDYANAVAGVTQLAIRAQPKTLILWDEHAPVPVDDRNTLRRDLFIWVRGRGYVHVDHLSRAERDRLTAAGSLTDQETLV